MENKENIKMGTSKGLIATLLFSFVYIFVYALIIGTHRPLAFIADNSHPVLYVIMAMLLGAIPYLFCGYLIMLARNSNDDLKKKNINLSLVIFIIMFSFYIVLTILQYIFAYRTLYTPFIMLNYPLLRATLFADLELIYVNIMMLLACIILPLFIYLGGYIRIKTIERGN